MLFSEILTADRFIVSSSVGVVDATKYQAVDPNDSSATLCFNCTVINNFASSSTITM